MKKFIYVFNSKEKDVLLALGYNLIVSNESKHMYIFENKSDGKFELNHNQVLESDVLTF